MATASCSERARALGPLVLAAAIVAGPAAASAGSGNAAGGRALFQQRCVKCHTTQRLAGLGDRVRNDMRKINAQMVVLGLLWDQDVADLRAFLNSLPPARSIAPPPR